MGNEGDGSIPESGGGIGGKTEAGRGANRPGYWSAYQNWSMRSRRSTPWSMEGGKPKASRDVTMEVAAASLTTTQHRSCAVCESRCRDDGRSECVRCRKHSAACDDRCTGNNSKGQTRVVVVGKDDVGETASTDDDCREGVGVGVGIVRRTKYPDRLGYLTYARHGTKKGGCQEI